MTQFLLTIVEVVLVVAALYIYWLTRKLLSESRSQAQPSSGNLDVAHDVTDLLAGLQTAADAARADWVRQNTVLQETLHTAEETVTELRALIERAEAASTAQSVPPQVDTTAVEDAPQVCLAEAVAAFSEHLIHSEHRSQKAAKRIRHVQNFAAWLGRQHRL